jgi:hypothetical protein
MRHGIHAPIMPAQHKPRYYTHKVSYWSLLAARMSKAPLMKTYKSGVAVWTVGAEIVDPNLVKQAIASGHLIVRDPGLFSFTDGLAYQLNPNPGGQRPPASPSTRNVELWVNRALRLKCAVCDNPVYASREAARADVEQILGARTSIDDLKDALAETAHGGRLCHAHM